MRNRRSRPSSKSVETVYTISERLNRLIHRIGTLTDIHENIIQRVQSLLDNAHYILITAPEVIDEDEVDLDDLDEDDVIVSSTPPAPPSRQQLRERMAGPLPEIVPIPQSSRKSSKSKRGPSYDELESQYGHIASRYSNSTTDVSKLRDSRNGLTGSDPNKFDIVYNISPDHQCAECGGPAEGHPIDNHLPSKQTREGDIVKARIMCDSTRAYMVIPKDDE